MAYLVLSRNGEESFNKFWSPYPDQYPDNVIEEDHGCNTPCLKKSSQLQQSFLRGCSVKVT